MAQLSRVPPFLRFALVGGAGFVVNEVALWIAIHLLSLGKDAAWFFAFVPAVTFTWWGNRTITFPERASDKLFSEWARFALANSLGAITNLAIYEILVHWLEVNAQLALAAGVAVGLVFNFTLSKAVVFQPKAPPSP